MKGQGILGIIIVIFLMIVVVVLLFGVVGNIFKSGPYVPSVSFTMTPTSVTVKNGTMSSMITLQVVKQDTKNIPTQFTINLKPSVNNVSIMSTFTGQPTTNYTTKTLTSSGSSDTFEFKVKGALPQGLNSEAYNITASLDYNGTSISQPQILTVQVTK